MDNTCDVFHHEGDWEANHITFEAVLHFVAAFVLYLFNPGCFSKCRSYTQTRAPLLSSGVAESGKTDCLLRGTSHQDPANVNAEMRCVIGVACIAGWDIQRHPASLQLAPAYSGPLFSRAAPGADYPCPPCTSQGLFSFSGALPRGCKQFSFGCLLICTGWSCPHPKPQDYISILQPNVVGAASGAGYPCPLCGPQV